MAKLLLFQNNVLLKAYKYNMYLYTQYAGYTLEVDYIVYDVIRTSFLVPRDFLQVSILIYIPTIHLLFKMIYECYIITVKYHQKFTIEFVYVSLLFK